MISHPRLLTLLTRKTSVALNISEQIVDEVIDFQWKSAQEATKKVNTVELSGMGKFTIRTNILKTKQACFAKYAEDARKKLANTSTEDKNWYSLQTRLTKLESDLALLTKQLENEC